MKAIMVSAFGSQRGALTIICGGHALSLLVCNTALGEANTHKPGFTHFLRSTLLAFKHLPGRDRKCHSALIPFCTVLLVIDAVTAIPVLAVLEDMAQNGVGAGGGQGLHEVGDRGDQLGGRGGLVDRLHHG